MTKKLNNISVIIFLLQLDQVKSLTGVLLAYQTGKSKYKLKKEHYVVILA